MNITKDFKNPVLKRREVELIFEADSNPGIAGAQQKITEQFKSDESKTAIKKITSHFGNNTFLVEANIYESEEMKNKIEPKKKEKKK